MYRQIFRAIFISLCGSILFIDQIEAKKFKKKSIMKGVVGAGLLLNTLTPSKGIIPLPLPVPLPLPIEIESSPVVIRQKPRYIPIPHPIPFPVHIPVHIPERRYDADCNYHTLINADNKIISREPLPTTIKGRTILRHCMQPVPNIDSGKYQVLFRGNQKSSFGSIRVSIKF